MYLGLLKESQKEMFLELAINLAKSDGDYSEEENAIITSYCQEMQISFEREKKNRSIDELVSEFALLCTAQEKKIIAFEIIGLAMCDNVYHEKENISSTYGRCNGSFSYGWCCFCICRC